MDRFLVKKKSSSQQSEPQAKRKKTDKSDKSHDQPSTSQQVIQVHEKESDADRIEAAHETPITDSIPQYAIHEDADDAPCEDSGDASVENTNPATSTQGARPSCPNVEGPIDISQLQTDDPTQPLLSSYPKKKQAGFDRSFNREWFKTYTWLEYSQSKDQAFCFPCRHFASPQVSKSYDPSFTKVGFSNWKKAKESNKGLGRHAKSECHMNAMLAWSDFKRMKSADTSIEQMINEAHQKEVKDNRHFIKTVAEILLLTAKQDIAQRGHRESEESTNKGNFLEILKLISNHDKTVAQKCTNLPKNAKYTSAQIQNEILEILGDMIRQEIIEEVKACGQFSLIVDETKDVSKTEQISFVLRYFYNGNVYESFLQFEAAEQLDAEALSNTILSCLDTFGVDYKLNLVGQGYDGASVMSGRNSGVATRIKEVCKNAVYIHCYAHRLNLVLVDTTKSVPEAADFFSLLERLYVFISGSYVHNKWKKVQAEMFPGEQQFELQRLSDTRWACRYYACRTIIKRLPAILKVLDEITDEHNPDRAVDARGLRAQLDFRFLAMLSSFEIILGESQSTSNILQAPKLDLAKATDVVELLKDRMKEYRTEEERFHSIWQDTIDLAEHCKIKTPEDGEQITRRNKRKSSAPARLEDSVLTAPVVEHRRGNTKDAFRIEVFYPILDNIISELDRRFSNENCNIMRGIQALSPESDGFLLLSKVKPFAETFNANMDDLVHELHQAKRLIERKMDDRPSSLLEFTCAIEPYKEAFHELYRLCKIAVTIPVTSASSERSFSALNLIKTYLRNSMGERRLSNLGIIHIERKRSNDLDLEEFIDIFANNHNNRKIVLV